MKRAQDGQRLRLVGVGNRAESRTIGRQLQHGREERLILRHRQVGGDAHRLPCGLHLRPQHGVNRGQLRHGEDGGFHRKQGAVGLKTAAKSLLSQRMAERRIGSESHHRHAGHLA